MSTPAAVQRPRALLLESIHDDAAFTLREAGFDVERVAGALGEDDLVAALPGVAVLGLRSNTSLTARAVQSATSLVTVGAFCIGTNQIDLAACSAAGVAVFNAPFSNTRSVVELAISEIIALTRRLTDKNADMHAGVWDKSAVGSHEVRGRRLGIVGYGNIGSQLSVLAEGLGMSVLFYDSADKLALGNARRCGTLEELLAEADVVSLHVDGRAGNNELFGEEQLARMRPREPVPQPLARVRRRPRRPAPAHRERAPRRCRGRRLPRRAAEEGRVVRLGAAGPAQRHPHAARGRVDRGGAAGHRRVRRRQAARLRARRHHLAERQPAAGRPAGRRPAPQRLLLLHRNTPGVLATVNGVLAEHGINVEAQVLGTRGAARLRRHRRRRGRRGRRRPCRRCRRRCGCGCCGERGGPAMRRRCSTALRAAVGAEHVLVDPDLRRVVRDTTGPAGSPAASAASCAPPTPTRSWRSCGPARAAGVPLVTQGGNTGLVGGGVPRRR